MLFFSSDFHIGHKNIIKYSKRPFDDLAEMEETIIERWNKVVGRKDTAYLVGDTFWQGHSCHEDLARKFIKKLNGHITLVEGNHDVDLAKKFNKGVRRQIITQKWEGHRFEICHYPMLTWNRAHHGAIMVHGHTHQTHKLTLPPKRLVHIGTDAWDFTPVSAEQIVDLLPPSLDHEETRKQKH